jgi:hypothetical protein
VYAEIFGGHAPTLPRSADELEMQM